MINDANPCEDMLAWQQAQAARSERVHSCKDGAWYARLVASDPRVARSFADHEAIASKLADAAMNGDEESSSMATDALCSIAASGMLDGPSSMHYREQFYSLMAQ